MSQLKPSPIAGWRGYFRERFPIGPYLLLISSFYLANYVIAQALTRTNEPIVLHVRVIAGMVTLFCFFLHLRIFDDHKDFRDDCRLFPDRTLQRGDVTLIQLAFLAIMAILVELTIAWLSGPSVFVAAVIAIGFSGLMGREFFVRGWLKKHFLIYALSHLLIMPLLALLVYSFATKRYPWEADWWFLAFAFVGFIQAFGAEVSRKVRLPSQERDSVITYTHVLGVGGAVVLLFLLVLLETVLSFLLGNHLGIGWVFFPVVVLLLIARCMILIVFHRESNSNVANSKAANWVEAIFGLSILLFNFAWIIALGMKHSWSFE